MRYWKILMVLSLMVLPVMASAGIDNTRHDMISMGLSGQWTTSRGSCSFCHIPHGAQAERLWAGTYNTTYTANKGVVSNLCYTCHGNSNIVDPGQTSNRMFTGSSVHRQSKDAHTSSAKLNQGWNINTQAAGTALPYVASTDNNTSPMECTSCHDVHGKTALARPFLRAPIMRTATATPSLCEKCHAGRLADGSMGGNTNATTKLSAETAKSTHPIWDGSTIYDGRTTSPVTWVDNVNRPVRKDDGTLPTPVSGRNYWILGGHLDNDFSTASTMNGVACVSCHMVHGEDPTNSVSAGADAYNDALVGRLDDSGESICTMCHGSNPGAASTNSHGTSGSPSNATSSTSGHGLVISMPLAGTSPSAPHGGSTTLMCTSCHDTHYGNVNTPILVDNGVVAGAAGAWCTTCHTGTITTNAYGHHPAPGVSTQWNTAANDNLWDRSLLSTSNNSVDCVRCHRVHNARAKQGTLPGAQFLLTGNNWDNAVSSGDPKPTSKMCVECHSANPSTYTSGRTDGYGSHFVSQARGFTDCTTLPDIQGTTAGASDAPEKWGSLAADRKWLGGATIDNAFSKYGGQTFTFTAGAGARGGMICESCHSLTTAKFAKNLLGKFDNTAFSSTNDNTAGGDGICRGCHQIPAGTHATTGQTVSRTGNTLKTPPDTSYAVTPAATGYQYVAFSEGTNEMTCWGCHNTHDADTGAAAYILKKGAASTTSGTNTNTDERAANVTNAGYPSLNFTPLCAGCHTSYK